METFKRIYLFIIYFVARIVKTPMFWVSVTKFKRWRREDNYVKRDEQVFWFLFFFGAVFYFVGLLGLAITLILFYTVIAIIISRTNENN